MAEPGQAQSCKRKHSSQVGAKGASQTSTHSFLLTGQNAQKYSPASLGGKRIKDVSLTKAGQQECLLRNTSDRPAPSRCAQSLCWVLRATSCRVGSVPWQSLKAMSTRVIRSPCLRVKPEFEKFISTTFLHCKFPHHEYKQIITKRDNSLKDDKVK